MKNSYSPIIILALVFSLIPFQTVRGQNAVGEAALDAGASVIGPAVEAGLNRLIDGASKIPSVPTNDILLNTKEVKMCFSLFGAGVCVPGLDKIAITVTKNFIERMVDSTVDWINNGFDGNPAYVDDPKQYFTDIADGVAGEFIGGITSNGTPLDFLCSPFQAQVKIALQKSYVRSSPFQCRLSDIVANVDGFFGDFSEGGWEGWFAMTQDNANNPYGSYIEAKIELDSRMAAALGIKRDQLNWGRGFLSFERCPEGQELDPAAGTGDCMVEKEIVTPGSAIESQLENVLGTGVRQLELSDEFDELIGALLGQLLNETVFSAEGLASAGRVTDGVDPPVPTIPTEPICPIPTTPQSLCENVDRDVVLEILNKYEPSNPGIEEAIVEVNTIYPEAFIIPHDTGNRALDKIDFGGGLIVDVIEGAVNPGVGRGWTWIQECDCGGPATVEPPNDPNEPGV